MCQWATLPTLHPPNVIPRRSSFCVCLPILHATVLRRAGIIYRCRWHHLWILEEWTWRASYGRSPLYLMDVRQGTCLGWSVVLKRWCSRSPVVKVYFLANAPMLKWPTECTYWRGYSVVSNTTKPLHLWIWVPLLYASFWTPTWKYRTLCPIISEKVWQRIERIFPWPEILGWDASASGRHPPVSLYSHPYPPGGGGLPCIVRRPTDLR